MSWSVHAEGTQDDVSDTIDAGAHVPLAVKEALDKLLVAFDERTLLAVDTHGHIGPDGRGNMTIQVVAI